MSKINAKTYRFDIFGQALVSAIHNFNSHSFKFIFTNNQPLSLLTEVSQIDEIVAENGYQTGGIAATLDASYSQESATKIVFKDVLLKAVGGHIGPFQFIVFANSSASSHQLCWFYDLGDMITVQDGNAISLNLQGEALNISFDAEGY